MQRWERCVNTCKLYANSLGLPRRLTYLDARPMSTVLPLPWVSGSCGWPSTAGPPERFTFLGCMWTEVEGSCVHEQVHTCVLSVQMKMQGGWCGGGCVRLGERVDMYVTCNLDLCLPASYMASVSQDDLSQVSLASLSGEEEAAPSLGILLLRCPGLGIVDKKNFIITLMLTFTAWR